MAVPLLTLLVGCRSVAEPISIAPPRSDLERIVLAAGRGETEVAFDLAVAALVRDSDTATWDLAMALATSSERRQRVSGLLDDGERAPADLDLLPVFAAILEPDADRRERRLIELRSEADPRHLGRIQAALGRLFLERGNARAALAAFAAATVSPSVPAEAYAGQAAALIRLDRPVDALEPLLRYLERRPHDARAHYNAGWILLELLEDVDRAHAHLDRARQLAPEDLPTQLAFASAALRRTPPDVEGASAALEQALSSAPDDLDVHWNLAVLYADHRHDRERALGHFRRYLELGGTDRQRVEAWIRTLESQH